METKKNEIWNLPPPEVHGIPFWLSLRKASAFVLLLYGLAIYSLLMLDVVSDWHGIAVLVAWAIAGTLGTGTKRTK